MFKEKYNNCIKKDFKIANKILDTMSETINKYSFEDFNYLLIDNLNKIENEYPRLFKEVNM